MDNGAGRLKDEHARGYEPMYVWREFKPRLDAIEYTVYYHVDGIKYRIDTTVSLKELDEAIQTGDQENIIADKIFTMIENGEGRPAAGYITYEQTE